VKTCRNLWPRICTFENLYLAWRKAKRGKTRKEQVIAFERELEENLLGLLAELKEGTYEPGEYTSFYVYETKRRKISAAPFRDRVVHHALCNVLESIFERRFIHDSYACRLGKGAHRALDRCTYFARRFPYVLQCDVAKFFPSVDHEILLNMLARYVGDDRTLGLCRQIVATGVGILDEEIGPVWFPGDDLFAPLRPKGLPIGNLTSQFWANVYLNDLDQYVKREMKVRAYLRYADDFLLFAESKRQLWAWRERVVDHLATLRLRPNARSFRVFPVRCGIDFLGFRVYRTHRRLLPANVRQARRRLRGLARAFSRGRTRIKRVSDSIQGWLAHAAHGNTWGLRRSVLREFVGRRSRDGGVPAVHQDGPDAGLAGPVHGEVPKEPTVQDGQAD